MQKECWWCLCESSGGVYLRKCLCREWWWCLCENGGGVYVREFWWCLSEKVLVQRVVVVFM